MKKVDQDPIIARIRKAQLEDELSTAELIRRSEVTSLYSWFSGKTASPRFTNVIRVLTVLGFRVAVERQVVKLSARRRAA